VAIGSLGLLFEAKSIAAPMAKKSADKILSGCQLVIATAEKVFGWKNVHKHTGELIGKKQDKLGRWRTAKVPDYASDPVHAYAIDERMKQLGHSEQYLKELAKITKANSLPPEWATSEQRSKAAIKVMGKK
jgi:hypothetical protein